MASNFMGHWKEFWAPRLRFTDLSSSSLPVAEQKRLVIGFARSICDYSTPCSESTFSSDPHLIANVCYKSASEISKLKVPELLPESVKTNLEIYRQSMINSQNKTADRWAATLKDGGSFWTFFSNWEIDTCSFSSIPQKVFRFYHLDVEFNSKIVTCENLKKEALPR